MRTMVAAGLVTAALGCAMPDRAWAGEWLFGMSAGQASWNLNAASGVTRSSRVDDSAKAYALIVGYKPSPYWGLEAGFVDLGETMVTTDVSAPSPGTIITETRVDGFALEAVGTLPVAKRFTLLARAGSYTWELERPTTVVSPIGLAIRRSKNDGNHVTYGVGVAYAWTSIASVRGEWRRFIIDDEDVDMLAASIVLQLAD